MVWDKDIGLLIINILMLTICILMFKKKAVLGSYGKYMITAMVLTYLIDASVFYIRLYSNIPLVYTTYIYIYGAAGLFFFLIFLMYHSLIKDKILKNCTKVIIVSFLGYFIFQVLQNSLPLHLIQNIIYFNVFLLLFVIALFLLDTFKTDIILKINYYYPFWFSLGMIIIYIGMIPSIILSDSPKNEMTSGLWSVITFIINFLGYGILLIGLINAKKIDK